VLLDNIIAVMTRTPEKKPEWWEDLRNIAAQARQ
jgi:hypothetical protein